MLLLIIIVSLIIVSSNFIWNIEIIEEEGNIIENIDKDVEEVGLTVGKLKSKINTKEIINKVRLKRKDIAWMGIELKGTNAIVKVVKADEDSIKFNLTSDFFEALDTTLAKYIKLRDEEKLSKEDILSCLEEACARLEEVVDYEL